MGGGAWVVDARWWRRTGAKRDLTSRRCPRSAPSASARGTRPSKNMIHSLVNSRRDSMPSHARISSPRSQAISEGVPSANGWRKARRRMSRG